MDPGPGHSHYVKRVVLPSGKTIEVLYFKDVAEAPEDASFRPGDTAVVEPDQDLGVCPECESELVHPTSWEESGTDTWFVTLRCPECEDVRRGIFSQSSVEAFDERLDAGTEELTADYRRLMRANMTSEVDRMITALQSDALLPEDF